MTSDGHRLERGAVGDVGLDEAPGAVGVQGRVGELGQPGALELGRIVVMEAVEADDLAGRTLGGEQ